METPETKVEGKRLLAAIEAVLFIYGEPIKIKKIAEIVGVSEEKVREGLLELAGVMKSEERGVGLMIHEDKATLVTKPELQEVVKKIVREEMDAELTPASLDALAIIAYLGPVSRAEVDYIRGVNSSFILRNLMVKGLVQKETHKDLAGNFLYNITFDFMKHVGVKSQQELPDYAKYQELMKGFSNRESAIKAEEKQ